MWCAEGRCVHGPATLLLITKHMVLHDPEGATCQSCWLHTIALLIASHLTHFRCHTLVKPTRCMLNHYKQPESLRYSQFMLECVQCVLWGIREHHLLVQLNNMLPLSETHFVHFSFSLDNLPADDIARFMEAMKITRNQLSTEAVDALLSTTEPVTIANELAVAIVDQ